MATCGYTLTSGTWQHWTTTSTTTSIIWDGWVTTGVANDTTTVTYNGYSVGNSPAYRQPTAEEQAANRAVVAALEKAGRDREADAAAAEKKAREHLLQHLTPEQKETLAKNNKFHVIASDGSRYEIDASRKLHNIHYLNSDGKKEYEYCIYQTGDCPPSDNILAQKLLLEADLTQFRRTANNRRVG